MQHDHRGHRRLACLLTAPDPARRWVAWDELPATVTTVQLAEAPSSRQPQMLGVMAQIPHQTAAGRLVSGFGSVPPGRLTGGRQWCLAGRPCERSCLAGRPQRGVPVSSLPQYAVPSPWLLCSAGPMTAHPGVGGPAAGLTGRRGERRILDRFVAGVRAGEGRALVVRGEPGVGKTVLLDYLAGQASGCLVARAAGVQSEMELAYDGLHQLCAAMLDRVAGLPGPQRDALQTAFGLQEGGTPEPFAVAVAALSLLSGSAVPGSSVVSTLGMSSGAAGSGIPTRDTRL